MSSFQRAGHRGERLSISPRAHVPGALVPIKSRGQALSLLRELSLDPFAMAALRRIYVEALGRAAICWESDQAVLEALSRRLSTGELKIRSVVLPEIPLPPVTRDADAAPLMNPQAKKKQKADEAEEPASLTNPRWSEPRVEIGTELDAVFTYAGFDAPKNATLIVFELDRSTAKKAVARVYTTVPAGSGDHKVKWKRKPEEAQADLEADEAAFDSGPLEYCFMVETSDIKCPDQSGPLWLTNTVKVKLVKEEDRSKQDKARVVVLKDALGDEFRATSKDGEAKFEKVLVGPIELRLAEPRFSDLGWSTPKVAVGKPVDAVFKYEDAIKGTKVAVVIQEMNADGTAAEIKRIELTLAGPSGEAKASFTRTEDEAQADIAADALEGDTGPVEYRYFVMTEDDVASQASGPLWLTHTVTLKLEHAEDGKSFPDGMELLLLGADGSEHRSKLMNGEVKFEEVVCGPMTLKLAPAEGVVT